MNLYLHVPFCRNKCAYCAFYSEPGADVGRRHAYWRRLERDLAAADYGGETVDTVYIGGGTPTLVEPEELDLLRELLARHVPLAPGAEVSCEANPETLTPDKVARLRQFVTRLSIGIQSFDAAKRQILGRDCSDRAIATALELVQSAAFPHWNCDLIYAVPGESAANWRRDLELAVASGADHLSCYSLTPEEGTRLVRDGEVTVDDALSADLWELTGSILKDAGFRRYEVSNYARPGGECRHNRAVWRGGRLIGLGPAAAGFDGVRRMTQVPDLERWLGGAAPELDEIAPEARRREIFAVNLRTADGWRREEFLALPGATASEWAALLRQAANFPGLLETTCERIVPTATGLLFWDEIATEFL